MEIMVSIYFESMISNSTLHGKIKFLSWSLLRRYFIFENTVERLKSSRDLSFLFLESVVQERINETKKFHKPRKIIEFRRRYKTSQRRID